MTNRRRRRQIRRHRPNAYPPFEHNAAVARVKARMRRYRAVREATRTARRAVRVFTRAMTALAAHINTPRQETHR